MQGLFQQGKNVGWIVLRCMLKDRTTGRPWYDWHKVMVGLIGLSGTLRDRSGSLIRT
jgi:hypothetical protein